MSICFSIRWTIETWVPFPFSAAKVRPDSTLQLCSTFANNVAQVLEVVARCYAKAAHKVLSSGLEITVILAIVFVLRSAKVRVGRDGCGALETLQSRLGLVL